MTDSSEFYNRYWSQAGFRPPQNRNSFLDAQLALRCTQGARVVDLGCGDGRTVGDFAASAGATYVGVDLSRSGVAAAKDRGLDVRLVPDVADTGLESQSCDAVFVIEVLEHLFDPVSAVKEAHRILKRGGALVVTVPNAAVWPRRLELLFKGRPNAMGDDLSRSEPWRDPHLRNFTLLSLGSLLSRGGFTSVEVGGTEPTVPAIATKLGDAMVRVRPTVFARRCTAVAIRCS